MGAGIFGKHGRMMAEFRDQAGALLGTASENLSFTKNTAEGMSMIANGFGFEPGDQVISYVHEYPSNHFPWALQQARGVELRLLPDRRTDSDADKNKTNQLPSPCGWSMQDLEELVTPRTKLVAVSHVQFTSGFAADLPALGAFCKERGIHLVIDAAQSLGCLPIRPEEWNISAVASSGWKWLLGPLGSGLLYTSPEFRARVEITMAGAEVVTQAPDYLDHRWQPHQSARKFEYSTPPAVNLVTLNACLTGLWNRHAPEDIRDHVFALQDQLLSMLDPDLFTPLTFDRTHRSGIFSFIARTDPVRLSAACIKNGVYVTERGGYLRMAPHIYLGTRDIKKAAIILNQTAHKELQGQ